jgi:hypothetical protein
MIKEKRQARRQPLRYTAWVALTADQRHGCVVSDVSDTGACIDVQDSTTIPDHFVLMLSSNGAARRFCRVMWRKPTQVGVKFERSLADAANATLAPKADADAPAASAPDATANAAPAGPAAAKTIDRLGRLL